MGWRVCFGEALTLHSQKGVCSARRVQSSDSFDGLKGEGRAAISHKGLSEQTADVHCAFAKKKGPLSGGDVSATAAFVFAFVLFLLLALSAALRLCPASRKNAESKGSGSQGLRQLRFRGGQSVTAKALAYRHLRTDTHASRTL